MAKKLTYKDTGVDYGKVDPVKVLAQKKAASTAKNLNNFGMNEVVASRGESAYVWEEADSYRALVIEGLGTKNLVADAVRKITDKSYYDQIAQDTIAMVVNDLIVVGAMPQVINAYFAVGDSAWMSDEERASDLVSGWAKACELAGATWGGGETPTLKGIIEPDTIDLGGSAIGIINPKKNLVLGDKLRAGDRILLIESSGIHANGITMARTIAHTLPESYATKMPSGKMFGEALLTPTHIYVQFVGALQEADLDIHYMVNITGHGWRKLMRATQDFTYLIEQIPNPHEEFTFMQSAGQITDKEMYGNYNMGAGFAVYLPEKDALKAQRIANKFGLKSWLAGIVEEGSKKVIIKPKDIVFEGETLGVR